jgi:hypothetical protein
VEAFNVRKDVAIVINLYETPGYVCNFRFDIAGILEEVAELKQEFRLHSADEIGQLSIGRTSTTQLSKGVASSSVRRVWLRLGASDRVRDPGRIVVIHD